MFDFVEFEQKHPIIMMMVCVFVYIFLCVHYVCPMLLTRQLEQIESWGYLCMFDGVVRDGGTLFYIRTSNRSRLGVLKFYPLLRLKYS